MWKPSARAWARRSRGSRARSPRRAPSSATRRSSSAPRRRSWRRSASAWPGSRRLWASCASSSTSSPRAPRRAPPVALPQSLRAFRHRNYRLYFVGQGTSQIGTWMQLIATSWLIYRLSGSAFLLGLAAFALQISFLVLAPVAGVLVDRMVKRRVLYATQGTALAQSLAMFALVASRRVEAWHLIVGNLVLGIVNAFDSPARQSFLVELVGGRDDLPNAIALSSALMNGARFVGPMIGGAVIATAGVSWGFGLNSVSYLAVLGAMRTPRRASEPGAGGWALELLAGFRYAYGFLPTRSALLLLAAVSFFAQPYQSLMPWFAKEAFHGNSATLGMLIGAGGAGAVS